MKLNKKSGITVTSIIVYVILFFIFTTAITVISSRFNGSLFDDRGKAINITAINKLEANLLNSASDSYVLNSTVNGNKTTLTFSNSDVYIFDLDNNTIYKNGGKLVKNVKECEIRITDDIICLYVTLNKYTTNTTRAIKINNTVEGEKGIINVPIGTTITGYIPTIATSTEFKTYDISTKTLTDTYFATQMGTNALEWQYMGLSDTGNILLISKTPTIDYFYLEGVDGYLNGPDKMNRACRGLYSNYKLGTARSVNIDDLLELLQYTGNTIGYYNLSNEFVPTDTYKTVGEVLNILGVTLNAKRTPDGTDINNYVVNRFDISKATGIAEGTIIDDEVIQNMVFQNSYWVASKFVKAMSVSGNTKYVAYNLSTVNSGNVAAQHVYSNYGDIGHRYQKLRPVVELNSNIKLKINKNGEYSLVDIND